MANIIQIRRDTAANWVTANPILADGEEGYEKDTKKFKIGDGITAWNSLLYLVTGAGNQIIDIVAGQTISGGKVVIVDTDGKAYVFDITNENHYGKMCGIAKQAATINTTLSVYVGGLAYEAGVGWTAGIKYYVSSTGQLTATPPSSGIVKLLAIGIVQDTVLITNTFEIITI